MFYYNDLNKSSKKANEVDPYASAISEIGEAPSANTATTTFINTEV